MPRCATLADDRAIMRTTMIDRHKLATVLALLAASAFVGCTATGAGAGHYAAVAGYDMYYEEYGHGRPLVLLHGGLNTIGGSFARQIPEFAKTHRVIAVEQAGHGHTPDARETLTYTQMADDTADLLRQLNAVPADVVGWSDGGIIALVIARRHPDLVRRLVISGASINVEGQRPEEVQALRDHDPDDLGAETARSSERGVRSAAAAAPSITDKVMRLWLTPVVLEKSDLARIEAPVLVVAGDRDVIRVEHTLEIFASLPHAQLCILPGTGHDTFQTAAILLNPLILRFLGGS